MEAALTVPAEPALHAIWDHLPDTCVHLFPEAHILLRAKHHFKVSG